MSWIKKFIIIMGSIGTLGYGGVIGGESPKLTKELFQSAGFNGTVSALHIDLPVKTAVIFISGVNRHGVLRIFLTPIAASTGRTMRKITNALVPQGASASLGTYLAHGIAGAITYSPKAIAKCGLKPNLCFLLYLGEGTANIVSNEYVKDSLQSSCSNETVYNQTLCLGTIAGIEGGESLVEAVVISTALAVATGGFASLATMAVAKTIILSALTGAASGVGVGLVIYLVATNPNAKNTAVQMVTYINGHLPDLSWLEARMNSGDGTDEL